MEFTHFDAEGNAVMVDVGGKKETEREAVACGTIHMSRECFEKEKREKASESIPGAFFIRIRRSRLKKGDIFEGEIGRVDFPNKGHVTVDGEDVIVKNGIPGQ